MCSSIVGVNTTSDRLTIEQLEHEITQKDRERGRETDRKRPERLKTLIRKEGGERKTYEYREKR